MPDDPTRDADSKLPAAESTETTSGVPGPPIDALTRHLALLQQPNQSTAKHDPLSVRARTDHQLLIHLAFDDVRVELQNIKITRFNEGGEFETFEDSTGMALPDGSLVNKTADVAYWCCKFRKKKQLKYCGPMTKDRANFCARCNRVLCARHAWQFLFSTKKHCAWCLFVRFIEVSLSLVALLFKLVIVIARGMWGAWFHAYR